MKAVQTQAKYNLSQHMSIEFDNHLFSQERLTNKHAKEISESYWLSHFFLFPQSVAVPHKTLGSQQPEWT